MARYESDHHVRRELEAHGVPFARWRIAPTEQAVVDAAEQVGYPIVLKAIVAGMSHKTDAGLVEVGIDDRDRLTAALRRLTDRRRRVAPDATATWLVEEMVVAERELLVGVRRDPVFGPVVVVGMGGTDVEVLDDVSMRVLPVDGAEIHRMLRELRSYPLLAGHRNRCPVDLDAVAATALALAAYAEREPRLDAVEINPLMVRCSGDGAVAVDVRMSLVDDR